MNELGFISSIYSMGIFKALYPSDDDKPDYLEGLEYGSGMVVSYLKGNGEVFCAGTCEWVRGLICHDIYTEIVTGNVLDKFCGKAKKSRARS